MKNALSLLSLRTLAVLVLALPALSACGGDDDFTFGAYCSKIGQGYCGRLISCGLATQAERTECTTLFQEGCCADQNRCGEKALNAAAESALEQLANSCSSAFTTHDCAKLNADELPAACMPSSSGALTVTPATPAQDKFALPRASDVRSQGSRVGELLRSSR